ncbi:hypothetical protein BDV18DRAFT_160664 [Aspergillus unguis]
MHFSTLLCLIPVLCLIPLSTARYNHIFPSNISNTPLNADYLTPTIDNSDLDAPKLSHANSSTFDWWTFDALAAESDSDSTNTSASVSITFSSSGPEGYPLWFPAPTPGHDNGAAHSLWAHIWISFPDGRTFNLDKEVEAARIYGSGDSVISTWDGAGRFMGSEEGYELEIGVFQDVPEFAERVNLTGRISYERITDAHSQCSTPGNFTNALNIGSSGLGWVSVMPDAIATVDFSVNGERLQFVGYGGHDKIWTSRPFTSATKSLVLGRAHLGLYSVLWLAYTPSTGDNTGTQQIVSSFIARDGETVSSGCTEGSVAIEQGVQETEGELVNGFRVSVPGGTVSIAADVETGRVQGDASHLKWIGRASGMFGDGEEEGGAVLERFVY